MVSISCNLLQPQILAEEFQSALVVAAAGSCLVSPPPPGPRQHRIVRRVGLPDQPVDEPSHFRNRQRYQGLIPVRLSPLLPQLPALACCRTTARQAWANIDSVMCRCQPSHFRTSYWSRPTLTGVGIGFLRWDMASNLQVRLGLRPGFGQQPDAAPEASPEQQPPQPVDAVADDAGGPYRPTPGVAAPGSRRFGRRPQVAWGNPPVMGVFHPGAIGQGQQRRHRQHQPVAGDARRVGSPGLVPLPAQALDGPPVGAEGRL